MKNFRMIYKRLFNVKFMERRAIQVILVTILLVALVAGTVFLKGNNAGTNAQKNSTVNPPSNSGSIQTSSESADSETVLPSTSPESESNSSKN